MHQVDKIIKAKSDIDIDVVDRSQILAVCPHVVGLEQIDTDGVWRPHKTGVHFDNIPTDPVTGYASIPYKEAEAMGYQKVDFLNVSAYKYVKTREDVIRLSQIEPNWNLLLIPQITNHLFQLRKAAEQLAIWKPQSIEELAMFIAMQRPAKYHLLSAPNWDEVRKDIWNYSTVTGNRPYFKKPHAFGYSLLIVTQLNSIVEHLQAGGTLED